MNTKSNKSTVNYLLICGAPKSGTTSLFRYLADHPKICPSNRKETYFFAREFDYEGNCTVDETTEGFERFFPHCGKCGNWRLEATPYTMYAKDSAQKISTFLPNSKILFILRDPVKRLISDYRFHLQREHPNTPDDFEKFIEMQFQFKGKLPNLLMLGCYVDYIRQFINHFDKSKMHLIFFDDFKTNPERELQNICNYLDIESKYYSDYSFNPQNQTINVKYENVNRLYMRLESVVSKVRERLLHYPKLHKNFEKFVDISKSFYFNLNNQTSNSNEEISASSIDKLIEFYRPYNLALSDEISLTVPWNSDN